MRPADGIDTRVSKGRTLSPYISVGLSVGLTISNLYNLLVSLQVFLSILLLVGLEMVSDIPNVLAAIHDTSVYNT